VYQGVAVLQNLSRVHRIRYNMFINRIQGQQEHENRYTNYVQRLVVYDAQIAAKLVPLCPNLKSLALGTECYENIAILSPLFVPNAFPFSNLRRLCIQWKMLPCEHRSCYHPIFRGLTHLETDIGCKSCWNGFPQLKNLTNLRLKLQDSIIPDPYRLLYAFMIADIICWRFPTSLNYITFCFRPDHSANIINEGLGRFCCNVDTGKLNHRLLFDWSCFRPLHPIIRNAVTRDWFDLIDSWVYLPRCHHDFWRREELKIDNRNRMYGRV